MNKPLEEEETLLEDGIIETSGIELKDTFVWLMSTIIFYIAMPICLVISKTRTQILSKYR
jgi:hypothetical protein